ncbi:hypothetical protein Tco_0433423, partial [Tanacetum coccineum]
QLPPFEALLWRGYTTVGYPGPPDFPYGQLKSGIESSLRLGFSQQIFEASRVRLIYPVLLELLILCVVLVWGRESIDLMLLAYCFVWICQKSQEISQKRTRERMSDQEAKEIKAKAREIMPQPSTALAGPDPEPMKEDQTGSDSGKLHVSLAGPNPEHNESHSGSMSSMKNLDETFNFGDQFLYDKPTEDDQEKSKAREESDSTIPDSSRQTVTSTPPVIAPFTDVSSSKPSLLVTPPPINMEATTITTSSRNYSMHRPSTKSARLEHTRYLSRNTLCLGPLGAQRPIPESRYLKRVRREIIRIQKGTKHMNKIKSANRNSANYRLYHALMEALIADEDAMDKEVADKVKDHKRKHDSDDDEDDGASGSAQPPTKDDEQSSRKPREFDASATKQHPALTLTGWQITDTRDAGADSSVHRSDPESEHYEQIFDDSSNAG